MKLENWLKRKGLEYKDGALFFAGISTEELSLKFGTPIYVTDEEIIRDRYHSLNQILGSEYSNTQIHYAVKANANLTILKILEQEGSFFDCTSLGEIHACFKVGISPERIIFTGNMFTNEDFEFALEHGVRINLDSISQLDRLIMIHEKLGIDMEFISFRINPEFGAGHHSHTITAGKEIKFGILGSQVIKAYKKAKKAGFQKFGIHQHIGSGIINSRDFEKATNNYLSIVKDVVNTLSISFEFIDFGGGLGIPYRPESEPMDLELYRDIVVKSFKKFLMSENIGEPAFKIEPGRFLSAESTIILAQINTIKDNGYKLFAGLNAGFNTLIRPTMYGSYHHIIPCNISERKEGRVYDITGPICESGDVLGKNRELTLLKEGDFVAILDAGAYGFVMSSNYNSRPRAAEILINKGKAHLIRKAESFDDLLKDQMIPDHLS